jgi:hypothetical protein
MVHTAGEYGIIEGCSAVISQLSDLGINEKFSIDSLYDIRDRLFQVA